MNISRAGMPFNFPIPKVEVEWTSDSPLWARTVSSPTAPAAATAHGTGESNAADDGARQAGTTHREPPDRQSDWREQMQLHKAARAEEMRQFRQPRNPRLVEDLRSLAKMLKEEPLLQPAEAIRRLGYTSSSRQYFQLRHMIYNDKNSPGRTYTYPQGPPEAAAREELRGIMLARQSGTPQPPPASRLA